MPGRDHQDVVAEPRLGVFQSGVDARIGDRRYRLGLAGGDKAMEDLLAQLSAVARAGLEDTVGVDHDQIVGRDPDRADVVVIVGPNASSFTITFDYGSVTAHTGWLEAP